jgi:flavin-binding protein dodecin
MNISDRSNAAQLIAALDKSGAKTPPAVAESYATTIRVSDAVRAIGVRPETVYTAIAAALTRGDDAASDLEVQRILASGQISNGGVIAGVDDIAFSRFREVCAGHADAIVTAFRKPFDQAATTLTTAHQSLGDVPLEDSGTILRIGGDAPAQWAKATAAAATVKNIALGWAALAAFTGISSDAIHHQVLRISAPSYEQWMSQELEGKHADPWGLVIAGLSLSLPTASEYRQRVAVITAGHAADAHQDERVRNAALTNRRIEDVNP